MKNLIFSLILLFCILIGIAYFLYEIDNRTVWYFDADGDGYGDIHNIKKSDALLEGYVTNNLDCNDNNSNISPEISQWYSEPFSKGDISSFDYDCDNQITQQYTQIASCPETGGWIDHYVPTCGEQGLWVEQCIEIEDGYQTKTRIKTQACH